MMIVSILLLNLLIALMGDSYGSVKEKGLAQWKLEQAQIITEMQGSMSEEDRNCTSLVPSAFFPCLWIKCQFLTVCLYDTPLMGFPTFSLLIQLLRCHLLRSTSAPTTPNRRARPKTPPPSWRAPSRN
jgi:hypothetical protein